MRVNASIRIHQLQTYAYFYFLSGWNTYTRNVSYNKQISLHILSWTTGTFHRWPSSIHFEYSSQSKKVTFWYSYHKSRYNPQRSEYTNDNLHIIIQPCGYHSTNNLWEKHISIENMRTAAVQLTIRDNLIDYIGTFTVSIGTCLFRHTKNTFLLPTTDSFSLYTSRICNLQLSSTKSRLRG